ncbi:11109_t:CDS:1, partial [Gigaspora rosea]
MFLSFTEKLKWFRKNEYINYRYPMMFPDNNRHIVEYRQIKITKDINIMVDSKFRSLLKNYKLFIKKEEIYYDQDKYLLE